MGRNQDEVEGPSLRAKICEHDLTLWAVTFFLLSTGPIGLQVTEND